MAFEKSLTVSNSKDWNLIVCVADWLLSQSLIAISLTVAAFLISYHTGNWLFYSGVDYVSVAFFKNIKDVPNCRLMSAKHICKYEVIRTSSWQCFSHYYFFYCWATCWCVCASRCLCAITGRSCPLYKLVIMPCVLLMPSTKVIYGWLHWVMVQFSNSKLGFDNRIG